MQGLRRSGCECEPRVAWVGLCLALPGTADVEAKQPLEGLALPGCGECFLGELPAVEANQVVETVMLGADGFHQVEVGETLENRAGCPLRYLQYGGGDGDK